MEKQALAQAFASSCLLQVLHHSPPLVALLRRHKEEDRLQRLLHPDRPRPVTTAAATDGEAALRGGKGTFLLSWGSPGSCAHAGGAWEVDGGGGGGDGYQATRQEDVLLAAVRGDAHH
eukprot:568774-Hanusia_phi.AAC.2